DYYLRDGPEKHRRRTFQDRDGAWRLTFAERKRILRNNIFGVDIDPQAVEVTRLSLQLAALENSYRRAGRANAPRTASINIRCGNALVGFDWHACFPTAFTSGGFHAVIGNPPWGQKEIAKDPAQKSWLQRRYPSSAGIFDLF